MRRQKTEKLPITLVLVLFFMSGATALVYEVVWTRMMMQVFGSTAVAVGTVLAAFMSGMAIGAWTFGKRADRSKNCLRLYAGLEIGIAAAALVSHLLLHQMAPAHRAIFELAGSVPVVFSAIRFFLAFTLIIIPTLLMGATLPVLARYLQGSGKRVGLNLSTLYGTNTLGAVSGVLVTGFFLIGAYGIHVPVYIAICANLLIGGTAWIFSRGENPVIPGNSFPATRPDEYRWPNRARLGKGRESGHSVRTGSVRPYFVCLRDLLDTFAGFHHG